MKTYEKQFNSLWQVNNINNIAYTNNGTDFQKRDIEGLKRTVRELVSKKNAVILTHIYQRLEVQDIADHVGDSLALSRFASNTTSDVIVFCGVHFMAETAKLLNPSKTVLLPDLQSGCPMADMISVSDLREFKSEHSGAPVVCYVNSSAAVKAESDICCTSTNAVQVVNSLSAKEVIFIPDKGLGEWVQEKLPGKKLHIYDGFCPTHYQITPKEVQSMRLQYPSAVIVAHPECDPDVWRLADFVGSTSQIYKFIQNSDMEIFIILSEHGLVARIQRDFPEKKIITTFPLPLCPNMKYHKLESVIDALTKNINQIEIDPCIFDSARDTITRMFAVTEDRPGISRNYWNGPKSALSSNLSPLVARR